MYRLRPTVSAAAFGNKFADWCTAAELKPVLCDDGKMRNYRAHGLRKAALRALAHAGCSGSEMMNVSGHSSLAQLQEYLDEVEQERQADAALTKLMAEGQNLNSELQTLLTQTYKPEANSLKAQEPRSRLAIPAGFEPVTHGVEIRWRLSQISRLNGSCCAGVADHADFRSFARQLVDAVNASDDRSPYIACI